MHDECHTACPLMCGEEEPMICTYNCIIGCGCPSDLYQTYDGECVEKENCPSGIDVLRLKCLNEWVNIG